MYAYELQETKSCLTGSRIPYLSPTAVVVGEEGIISYEVPQGWGISKLHKSNPLLSPTLSRKWGSGACN